MPQRKRVLLNAIVITVAMLAALGGMVLAEQDKSNFEIAEWARVL